MSLNSTSTCLLNNSRDGCLFTALGSLLQCLTNILGKKLFLMAFSSGSPGATWDPFLWSFRLLPGRRACCSEEGPKELTNPASRPVWRGPVSLPSALSSPPCPYLRLESWGRLPGRSCSEPPSAASGPRRRRPWGSGTRPAPPRPWWPLAAASAGTKRAGKKYHAVTGGAACGTGSRRAPRKDGMRPDVLRCWHATSVAPPRIGCSSHHRGRKQRAPRQILFLWSPPCHAEVCCNLDLAHQVRKAEKSLCTVKTQYTWAEWFRGLRFLYQNSGKAWRLLVGVYVGKGDSFSKAEILTSSQGIISFFPTCQWQKIIFSGAARRLQLCTEQNHD